MSAQDGAGQQAGDEHLRFARYQQELAQVREEDEQGLVAAVLRDPDAVMAQSAVAGHLDRRAAGLLADARFPGWARGMAPVIAGREFLAGRLREWILLRSVTMGDAWAAEDLAAASDWLQRKAAETVTSPAVLALLASRGRTRRVRGTASRRITRPEAP